MAVAVVQRDGWEHKSSDRRYMPGLTIHKLSQRSKKKQQHTNIQNSNWFVIARAGGSSPPAWRGIVIGGVAMPLPIAGPLGGAGNSEGGLSPSLLN